MKETKMEPTITDDAEVVPTEDTEEVPIENNEEISIEEPEKIVEEKDFRTVKTLRLMLNWFTNALIVIIVFVCVVYACSTDKEITLHIILFTVGYQFFMCQGVLALTQYNSWTVYLRKSYRIHIHWVYQVLGVGAVISGIVLYILKLPSHFNSLHGILGIVALLTTAVTFLNGIIVGFVSKFSNNHNWILGLKTLHYITGSATLMISGASLCLGFETESFKLWLSQWFDNHEIARHVLQLMIVLFTLLVCVNFLIPIRRITKIN